MTALRYQSRTLGSALAAWWLAFYTAGLPVHTRDRRRIEIASDVWEHEADRASDGLAASLIGLEILERVVRGMPADLLWRFQLEGPKVTIHVPVERIIGGLLLCLVVLIPISTAISGYDTARDSWEGELTRLGELAGWQVTMNTLVQVASGIGLLAGAAAFFVVLRGRAPVLSALATIAIAAAGVVVLIASATYAATAELADNFVHGETSASVVTTSHALALIMDDLVQSTILLLALGVYGLAIIGHRQRLVPRWMGGLAAASAVLVVAAAVFDVVANDLGAWLTLVTALMGMLAWLIIAGCILLLGRPRGAAPSPGLPEATPM